MGWFDHFKGRNAEVHEAPISDFSWIDEFIANIQPYVFVRAEDNLLIKLPNQATQLNPQGVRILTELMNGKPIGQLLEEVGGDSQKIYDIVLFIHQVKRFLEGDLNELTKSKAVEVRPFDMRFSKLPVLSEIAVTYRCNLKCSFCYAGCNCTTNPSGDEKEMDEAQVKEVLDQLFLEARVPSVSFTGGEATIRKDLPELVHYAKNLGMRVNLITNGTLVSRSLAEELASSGLASAQVSLEGVTAETHEKLTRIRGSFRKTLAAVGHFQEARVRVHTNTTINRENLLECLEMPGFVKRELERPRFSMNLLIPTGSATLAGSLVVGYGEIGPYLAQILEASRKEEVEFMWYSPTPLCLFNPIAHQLGNKGCSACDGLISIAANGDVLPCSSYDDPVGNLLKENILAIWNSEKSCWYRNKRFAHQKCQSCVDFQVCHGACPIYWREQGFGELEFEFGNQPEKGEGKECFCQKPMNAV